MIFIQNYTNCFSTLPQSSVKKFRRGLGGTSAAEVMLRALGDHAIPKLARFKVSAPCVFHVFFSLPRLKCVLFRTFKRRFTAAFV